MTLTWRSERALTTAIFGVATFLFWRFAHPESLSCAEELQLFLFNKGYLTERLAMPGGLAAYAGEFITQFFNPLTLGAAIVALTMVAIQMASWGVMRQAGAEPGNEADGKSDEGAFAFSFGVPCVLIICMGEGNLLMGYAVAMLMALGACAAYLQMGSSGAWRGAVLCVGLPALFWLAGVGAYAAAAFVAVHEVRTKGAKGIGMGALAIVACVVGVVASYRLSAFPLWRVAHGLGIYRTIDTPLWPAVTLGLLGLWCGVAGAARPLNFCGVRFRAIVVAGLVMVAGFGTTVFSFNKQVHEGMAYDLLLRQRNWKGIIAKAEKSQPTSPLCISTLNLALAMRGELGDRMFEFRQVTSEGLIPLFKREVMTSMMTSDIYFELGMVNTARRFAFEAQEAIPDMQKSGRLTKRLAECALINGHYAVAQKYVDVLSQTFAYGKWAAEAQKMIDKPEIIDRHPQYGKLRRHQIKEDFFYSDTEMDQMLGLLFTHDNSNTLALDYLLALELLTRDVQTFARYAPLMGKLPGGGRIVPRHYQEALCMAWAQKHNSFGGMPWPVQESIKQQFMEFARLHSMNKQNPKLDEGTMGSSYWTFFVRATESNN